MKTLVGVQFKKASRIYDFDAGTMTFVLGDRVVVETERGLGLGTVLRLPREVPDEEIPKDLKRVIRKANASDLERHVKNCEREKRAMELCKRCIKERGLEMKLVNVDFFYDASKAVFHFVAAQRVDFRELVKDLAQALHTRIEMKQVGVRDETKLIGGIGCCGRTLCCASFLRDFTPVNVKMAKEQNLAMNPSKISGVCGRLMCCLGYEASIYHELGREIQRKGKTIQTTMGPGKILDVNALKRTITIALESGATVTIEPEKIIRNNADQAESGPEEKDSSDDAELKE